MVEFLDYDRQLKNRSMVMEFAPETIASANTLKAIVERIFEKHACMKLAENARSDEFVARLIHATNGAFGTIIQVVRAAVEHVLHSTDKDGRPAPEVVTLRSFAAVYAAFTGCSPAQNVFTATKWHDIVPSNALRKVLEKRERERKKVSEGGAR